MSTDNLVERLGFAYNKLSEDILEEAAARIFDLEAELAAAREDAERYRAIRAVEAQGQTLAAYDANVDRMYARKGTT